MNGNDEMKADFKAPDGFGEKLLDAAVPGFAAECDPEKAEAMGAFAEDALDWDEALAVAFDIAGDHA